MFQGRMYVPAVIGGVKTTINSFLKGIPPPPHPRKKIHGVYANPTYKTF